MKTVKYADLLSRPKIKAIMKKLHYREQDLQIRCVKYFRIQYPAFARLLFHPKNEEAGGRERAAIAKAEGVQAGVADLLLHVQSRYEYRDTQGILTNVSVNGLAVEMKTKTGRQSESQRTWQRYFEAPAASTSQCATSTPSATSSTNTSRTYRWP